MLLLTLSVCLAVTATVTASGYEYDRIYRYRYHGYLYTGFTGLQSQHSGLAFNSDVVLVRRENYYNFQLENFRYDKFHSEIDDFDDHSNYEYKHLPSLTEHLTKPVRAHFKDGQLEYYEASPDDVAWSLNIKRGILSLFNLNFDSKSSHSWNEGDHYNQYQSRYYRLYEDGLGGECETSYIVQAEPYYETPYHNNVLNVTKTRNYHRCVHQPYRRYVTKYGYECVSCEDEKTHPFHVQPSRYHYNIRGSRQNYVIERVVTDSEATYSPFTTRGQTVYVYLNRTLELVDEEQTRREDYTNREGDYVKYHSLAYRYENRDRETKVVDLKRPHYLYDVYGYQVPVQQVGRLLQELSADESKDDRGDERTSRRSGRFLELVRAFSTLDYDSLDELYRLYVGRTNDAFLPGDKGHRDTVEHLFVGALAATGTNPTFSYAKYLIENRHLRPELVKYYLYVAPSQFKEPTETLLDEVYRLCEHPYIRENHELRTAAYLGFSVLVYETCVVKHKQPHSEELGNRCTPETASKYFNYLIPSHRYENDQEQILYLKTAGYFGLKETIGYVKHYIVNRERYPLYYRVTSLWALNRVAREYPEEVMKLVLPLYFDESEDHEVRIVAFTLTLLADPPSYYLETIANSLYQEPSDQVFSYVYSTFYYLANSTHPCHKRISEQAKVYLNQLLSLKREFHLSLDHSFNFYTSTYEEEYDYGGFTQIGYIASNSSYVPRSAYFRLNEYFGGRSHTPVSLGFQTSGLDRYFDHIFRPTGPYRESTAFEAFGGRSPRDVDTVQKELKELNEKVHIKNREYEPVYGDIFLEKHGVQISLFQFNESLFEYLFNREHHAEGDGAEVLRKAHLDYNLPGTGGVFVVPTDLGLPLLLDDQYSLHIRYDSKELKVNYAKEKNRIVPTRVKAQLEGHLLFDNELHSTLGVVVPFERTTYGVGIYRHERISLPLHLEASLGWEKKSLNFKYVPETPHKVYHLEYEPFSYIDSYDNLQPVRDEDSYVPLYNKEHLETHEENYFHAYLGIGLKTKVWYKKLWNDYGSWYEFLTSSRFPSCFNPDFNPYHVDVYLTSSEQETTEQVEGEIKYDYHGLVDGEDPYKSEHVSEGLEDYGRTGSDRKWKTHVITAELRAAGQRERNIKTELTYSYTYDHLYHKYHLYYDRTPFHHSEKDHFKICFSGIWSFPHHDYKKLYNLDTLELDHSVTTSHNLNFGVDCKKDKKVTIVGSIKRTEEQKQHESRREEPVTYERYNEYAYYYQKCLQERQRGFHYNSYCRYYLYITSQLLDYQFDITYENLPESFRNFTYKLVSHIKHIYYHHVDHDSYTVNTDGRVRVEANLSLHDPVADLRVYKPHATTYYNRIYLRYFRPINIFPSLEYSYLQEYVGFYDYPYCVAQRDYVNTFDNLTYTRQSTDCYEILARDCSPKQDFIVLGKKINHQRYEKAVRVFFGKYKVEMLPVSEDSDIIVRVNGKRVTVVEGEPYYHYVTEGDSKFILFFVSYNGLYYKLHSHPYSLTVDYSGKVIYVQVSPYYRGKLCGLCGDYDSDRHNELKGPGQCVYHDPTSFGYSYAVSEDGCTVPEYEKSPCVHKHGQRCVQHRNRYVSTGNDRNRKICFSTVAVPRCDSGCRPTKTVTRKLAFHCLPAREGFTKYLHRESEYRPLDELRKKSEDYETEIDYPEDCYYPEE